MTAGQLGAEVVLRPWRCCSGAELIMRLVEMKLQMVRENVLRCEHGFGHPCDQVGRRWQGGAVDGKGSTVGQTDLLISFEALQYFRCTDSAIVYVAIAGGLASFQAFN
ncbi:hypothetical protein SS50377_26067 [Spironucleus salmonicida]|nr:hypothetical protein SS50377_26067 [Spironucleus salmonicida]|eukprot:EST42329.1 Hypothetical protein SS50377_18117 [Spironucleus salmonicida]